MSSQPISANNFADKIAESLITSLTAGSTNLIKERAAFLIKFNNGNHDPNASSLESMATLGALLCEKESNQINAVGHKHPRMTSAFVKSLLGTIERTRRDIRGFFELVEYAQAINLNIKDIMKMSEVDRHASLIGRLEVTITGWEDEPACSTSTHASTSSPAPETLRKNVQKAIKMRDFSLNGRTDIAVSIAKEIVASLGYNTMTHSETPAEFIIRASVLVDRWCQ